ncbi:MAG: hypothetical protein RXS23_03150 [Metallosphaera yellowstonensis]|jgi:hypothetical protein|uniref:Uncharacterized protein n=1 Tax=Metallosphaera yellowstonensis MK1 TaxID=671065 RepID=H2C709_9CREN|nr:hypothetical protein [Metallosphaera yellowstonensis]EHP69586.1 hypothetical protein MetMK1DRAFT_00023560 [Metallosphaera yellowstonensis MK1]
MLIRMTERQFDQILTRLKSFVYEYNSRITRYDVYLKPFHIVYKKGKKYIYIGKYWYKLEKMNGKLKWIYLGKEKPIPELPDPPRVPEITIIKEDSEYVFDDSLLKQLK